MIVKHPLVPQRIRRPPPQGWSWIDRRFLREHAAGLSRDAILLYFFLAAVSDKHGLSYYSDATVAARLSLSAQAVPPAREQLLARDLVAYRAPFTQVLSLPEAALRRGGVSQFGELLRQLADPESPPAARPASARGAGREGCHG